MGTVKPSKMLPAGSVISTREYSDCEIHEIPKDCYIRIDGYSGDFDINIISKVPIPNPRYEIELEDYNRLQEIKKGILREQRKQRLESQKIQDKRELEEYKRLKKKFEGK